MMAVMGSFRAGDEPEPYRKRLLRNLRALGVLRIPAHEIEGLEGAMVGAVPPVMPSDDFRNQLRNNLALAARQRVANLAVEYPPPIRQGILLGLSAGVATAVLAILLILLQNRRSSATR